MLKLLALAAAGAAGTLARYGLSGWAQRLARETFPWGTLAVNLAGCFAIGVAMALVRDRQVFSPEARTVLVVGFLGGFTTFSAFGYETLELLRNGSLGPALGNAAASVLGGLVAVWLGDAAARFALS
ncbi:MAG: fluoride efflux transporter CrcB [Acidobacteria bacterium]|jgi:CrcB protein|nr:fluoride efflux transporter CrcB [Acidobacteriota bacterium]